MSIDSEFYSVKPRKQSHQVEMSSKDEISRQDSLIQTRPSNNLNLKFSLLPFRQALDKLKPNPESE